MSIVIIGKAGDWKQQQQQQKTMPNPKNTIKHFNGFGPTYNKKTIKIENDEKKKNVRKQNRYTFWT